MWSRQTDRPKRFSIKVKILKSKIFIVTYHLLYLVTLSYLKLTKYHHHNNVEEMCDVKDLSRPNSLPRCLRRPHLRPSPRPKAALSSWSGAPARSPPSRPTSARRQHQLRTSPAGKRVTCMSVLSCMHLINKIRGK